MIALLPAHRKGLLTDASAGAMAPQIVLSESRSCSIAPQVSQTR
jgi:hypothetical protein